MAFGSASATVPSISIAPSFLAKQYLLIYSGVDLRTSAHFWAESNPKARGQKDEIGATFVLKATSGLWKIRSAVAVLQFNFKCLDLNRGIWSQTNFAG